MKSFESIPPATRRSASSLSRSELRRTLRQRRQSLSFEQQQQAAEALAVNLLTLPGLHRANHIALYLPNDGEIDPTLFLELAEPRGRTFYLPVLHPVYPGRLVFSAYHDGTGLRPNRFGIPEPRFSDARRPAWALDAVLFPLVGFDDQGGRLGMGGGFYDRTFAFSRLRPRLAPKLIGLAHDFQRVDALPVEPWDVPLHAVVTDQRCYRFGR
ncbi:MAG TPA: 5-formyltetrahydrofolate cyclo-ligase [Marinobacter sp.]|nr:5-formyltetrahydrofolate cyclo-ligase [Marinobacter sp.]